MYVYIYIVMDMQISGSKYLQPLCQRHHTPRYDDIWKELLYSSHDVMTFETQIEKTIVAFNSTMDWIDTFSCLDSGTEKLYQILTFVSLLSTINQYIGSCFGRQLQKVLNNRVNNASN